MKIKLLSLLKTKNISLLFSCVALLVSPNLKAETITALSAQPALPSVQEICDYINDKVAGDDAGAAAIEARYNGSTHLCSFHLGEGGLSEAWDASVNGLFQKADQLAAELSKLNAPSPWGFCLSNSGNANIGSPLGYITFQLEDSTYKASCNPNQKYLRPNQWDQIPGTPVNIGLNNLNGQPIPVTVPISAH